MHNQDIISLVIFLVDNATELWRQPESELPSTALEGYWLAARLQVDHWTRHLKALEEDPHQQTQWPYRHQRGGLAEEIITQELITRIWLAVLRLYEQRTGKSDVASLPQSVYLSHIEIRGRVLASLNRPDYLPKSDVQKLVQLCERTDRWSDLLLGKLAEWGDVGSVAVDTARMLQFAADYRLIKSEARRQQTWKLMKASLQAAYSQRLFLYQPVTEWTFAVASHIVSCFPSDRLESFSGPSFLQSLRLITRCRRTEELLSAVLPG